MSSLSERTMLSALHISTWSGMMFDRQVTEEISERHKADLKTAGRYNKRLVAAQFLADISSAHSYARNMHRLLTLPWDDDGTRILTTKGYMKYQTTMKECKLKCEAATAAFCTDEVQAQVRDEARMRLKTMFNEQEYPTVAELKTKFGFDIEIRPLPQAADFRAELADDAVKAIVADIEKRSNDRVEKAMQDVYNRVVDVVKHLAEKLRDYVPPKGDQKRQGIIRDSAVYSVYELAELLPSLNVTGDKRLDEVRSLMGELYEHSPEILRADDKVRKDTMTKADKLLKKLQSYYG